MGLQLARAALFHAERTGLGDAPTRLLLHMAIEAYDDGNAAGIPPRRYFHPRSDMAAAMGYPIPARRPERTEPEEIQRRWANGHQRVKRALKELHRVEAVKHIAPGRPGFYAEFEVTVSAVDPVALSSLAVPHAGSLGVPHAGSMSVPMRVRQAYPQTESPEPPATAAEHHLPAQPHDGGRVPVENSDDRSALRVGAA